MILIILMVGMPVTLLAQQQDDYLQGKMQGELDAKGSPVWILAGLSGTYCCLLFGVAGIGAAYMIPPSPPINTLLGKSSNYVIGYTEGYKNKAKKKNATYASFGCLAAALINILINASAGNI